MAKKNLVETVGAPVKANSARQEIVRSPRSQSAPIRRRRKFLAELFDGARENIFRAASRVVSEHGYAKATISRVTEAAGIAEGTFYLYFNSRQELFDELLPYFGKEMLDFIGKKIAGGRNIYELEERGLRAYFEYMNEHPGFFRLVNDAEVASPVAYRTHYSLFEDKYIKFLKRCRANGEIRNFEDSELKTLSYMLISTRTFLYIRCRHEMSARKPVPEGVVHTYMKLLRGGLV